jgi:hypothetical protein
MKFSIATARLTRPADAAVYAAGDLIANSITAGSVLPLVFEGVKRGIILRALIGKSGPIVTNAQFRLHLFSRGTLTFANGDNGVLSCNGAADYLGAMEGTLGLAFTDSGMGIATPISGMGSGILLMSGSLFGVLEARAAYTPISAEVFTVQLEIEEI